MRHSLANSRAYTIINSDTHCSVGILHESAAQMHAKAKALVAVRLHRCVCVCVSVSGELICGITQHRINSLAIGRAEHIQK